MAVEVLLSFDGEGAYEALGKAFENVIADLCDMVLQNAAAPLEGDPFYAGARQELEFRFLSLAESGLIDGQVSSNHWTAWIAEWGSGSEMDTTNPEYEAYKGSVLWNRLRDGNAITGREAGDYPSLDGTTHTSSGLLAGVNLEMLMATDAGFAKWAHEHVGIDAFQPKVPLHFMRDALESNRPKIIDQLNAVLEVFNFGTFFV